MEGKWLQELQPKSFWAQIQQGREEASLPERSHTSPGVRSGRTHLIMWSLLDQSLCLRGVSKLMHWPGSHDLIGIGGGGGEGGSPVCAEIRVPSPKGGKGAGQTQNNKCSLQHSCTFNSLKADVMGY